MLMVHGLSIWAQMARKGLSVCFSSCVVRTILSFTVTETDSDYALRLLSLEDDPTLPIFTFRMWFLSLGLSCFGAVLGQIFVRFQRLSARKTLD